MKSILVVETPDRWPRDPGTADADASSDDADTTVPLVAARDYFSDPRWQARRRLRVVNLCRSMRYQSVGYYVSLLAEARGQSPLPTIETVEDLKRPAAGRGAPFELERPAKLDAATPRKRSLEIFFGRLVRVDSAEPNPPDPALERLARRLFARLPTPILDAEIETHPDGTRLVDLRAPAVRELDTVRRGELLTAARAHLAGPAPRRAPQRSWRAELAILVDPEEPHAPSDEAALRRFERVGREMDLRVERIGRDDAARLDAFDALFLRATTSVDHFTYRMARRAERAGLAVLDDPRSILRCSNKVFLAESLERAGLPMPKTRILQRSDVERSGIQRGGGAGSDFEPGLERTVDALGLPLVLKLPDGSFSRAVVKIADAESLERQAREYFEQSELLIAQQFLPTAFDWRVGVLADEVLYAARYRMAPGHWQIARASTGGKIRYGGVEAVPLDDVPPAVLDVSRRAAATMGRGLYGVDLKELPASHDGPPVVVVEVNDNPNLDAGCEDAIAGDDLYRRILGHLVERVEAMRRGRTDP